MSTRSLIENLLTDAFSPNFLEVRDVSAAHYGHAGAKEGVKVILKLILKLLHFLKKPEYNLID